MREDFLRWPVHFNISLISKTNFLVYFITEGNGLETWFSFALNTRSNLNVKLDIIWHRASRYCFEGLVFSKLVVALQDYREMIKTLQIEVVSTLIPLPRA
jgi:hypothetical protein